MVADHQGGWHQGGVKTDVISIIQVAFPDPGGAGGHRPATTLVTTKCKFRGTVTPREPICSAYDHHAHPDRPVRHPLDPDEAAHSDFFLGMTFLVGTALSVCLLVVVFDASARAVAAPCLVFVGLIPATTFAMYRFCIADRRSALRLLAAAKEEGCTEAILQAQGFQQALITGLLADRVAIRSSRPIDEGGRSVEVTRLWITEAGRSELAEPS
jgi:hypothetical protein